MNEFPELPEVNSLHADPDETTRRRNNTQSNPRNGSTKTAVIAVMLSIVAALLISLTIAMLGKDPILQMFGLAPESKKPDPFKVAIEEMSGGVKQLADDLDTIKLKQSELQENINAGNFATQKATQRLENLERFSSSLEQKIEQQKKVQQAAAAKPVVKAAPKPVPIIPVVLISIRNIAGTSYVSLRDGLDDSDLLMPGDTWRGWTLITADTATKSAIFTVAGKQQELRL